MIIDEFTGRILEGRRWSEGLHQAIEAKEGVRVQEENQTLATITLQNYFRLYDKLAGMTGTALTEATEFKKIYELGVVQIPTNQPMVRDDRNDQVYKTKDGKWSAVVREIAARHERQQPVLVGTISVEVSELLSEQLRSKGIDAHGAQRQARVRRARGRDHRRGRASRRGHDRDEHGRPRRRHQARRQPRAPRRAGAADQVRPQARRPRLRAADRRRSCRRSRSTSRKTARRCSRPAASSSAAPSATSRAASTTSCAAAPAARATRASRASSSAPRTTSCASSPATGSTRSSTASARSTTEGNEEPIEAGMLTQADREGAEEGRGAELPDPQARPRVRRRDERAAPRRLRLPRRRPRGQEPRRAGPPGDSPASSSGSSTSTPAATTSRTGTLERPVHRARGHHPGRRPDRIRSTAADVTTENLDREGLGERLEEEAVGAYDRREEQLGDELMRALERFLLLQIIDQRWREHLYDMDYLREGIHLRGFAQIEPIIAYKNEAFTLFQRPHELDLVGLLADGVPRRGRGGGRGSGGGAVRRRRSRQLDAVRLGQLLGRQRVGRRCCAAAAAGAPDYVTAYGDEEPMEVAPPRRAARPATRASRRAATTRAGAAQGKKFKKCHGA